VTESSSDTAPQQRKIPGKPFVKGDKRINRKGRPKSFDKLRELAVSLANEAATATKDGVSIPITIDGHQATQIEMLLRTMMRENPARFVEIAYGKVPDQIELGGNEEKPITIKVVRVSRPEDIS
jgi:hypothetical protein